MRKVFVSILFIGSIGLFLTGCDSLLEEVEACVNEFAEYEDEAAKYKDIEGSVCDNKQAAQDFINFLETEAKGSCVEEQLSNQGQSLDDIIADAQAKVDACN